MTRDEMVAYIADRMIIDTADTTRVASIVAMLKEAHLRVVSELELLQMVGTLTLTPGDPQVALPNRWFRTRYIRRGDVTMQPVSAQEFAGLTSTHGGPMVYVQQGATHIRVYPTPTEAGTASILYDAQPASMSSGADTPEGLPLGYHEIIPELVIQRVALAEEEPALAAAAKQIADELTAGLRVARNRRSGQWSSQQPVYGLNLRRP